MQGLELERITRWIARGRYRKAVVECIRKPVTIRELLTACRCNEKSMRFPGLWVALQQLEKNGVIRQLNEGKAQGKIYFFTDLGETIARRLRVRIEPVLIEAVHWKQYSFVARSCIRRLVVAELQRLYPITGVRWSAARIREHLNQHHPISMDNLIRTLNELQREGIVHPVRNGKPNFKGYRLTSAGLKIAEVMAL